MWIVELTFTGGPERLAARPAHRDRLVALHRDGTVLMAGPYTDDTGALIILDVPGRAAADAVLAADPYFTTPGVSVTDVREWTPLPL
ncbi:YciI family protein [Actinoplanes sp. GCM10030250]|uniref:YciI family protein n=1 Tax=Actinoplanes sp. GCM10030250 TaxID=3273376 RepID=UPI00360D3E59